MCSASHFSFHYLLSWVFARPELYEPVIEGLKAFVGEISQIYLVSTPEHLEKRLSLRGDLDRLEYAKDRLILINALRFTKIDTSDKSESQVVNEFVQLVQTDNNQKEANT